MRAYRGLQVPGLGGTGGVRVHAEGVSNTQPMEGCWPSSLKNVIIKQV